MRNNQILMGKISQGYRTRIYGIAVTMASTLLINPTSIYVRLKPGIIGLRGYQEHM